MILQYALTRTLEKKRHLTTARKRIQMLDDVNENNFVCIENEERREERREEENQ